MHRHRAAYLLVVIAMLVSLDARAACTVLPSYYAAEGQWHYGVPSGGSTDIPDADAGTFHLMSSLDTGHYVPCANAGSVYAADANNVYLMGQVIPGASPSSFIPLVGGYAVDIYHIYLDGKILKNSVPPYLLFITLCCAALFLRLLQARFKRQ